MLNGGNRYIQFVPTSAGAVSPYNAQSFGLNELKVFGTEVTAAVPEPATWAMMMMGLGIIGIGLRQRAAKGGYARTA